LGCTGAGRSSPRWRCPCLTASAPLRCCGRARRPARRPRRHRARADRRDDRRPSARVSRVGGLCRLGWRGGLPPSTERLGAPGLERRQLRVPRERLQRCRHQWRRRWPKGRALAPAPATELDQRKQLPDSGQRIYLPSPRATCSAPGSFTNTTSGHVVAAVVSAVAWPLRRPGGPTATCGGSWQGLGNVPECRV